MGVICGYQRRKMWVEMKSGWLDSEWSFLKGAGMKEKYWVVESGNDLYVGGNEGRGGRDQKTTWVQ